MWTCRPTFAPNSRSKNLLQPNNGRGLYRKKGVTSDHKILIHISLAGYFCALLFAAMCSLSGCKDKFPSYAPIAPCRPESPHETISNMRSSGREQVSQ